MRFLPELFENNRRWAEGLNKVDPAFFEELSAGQSPKYLWIGCSDSRVPANQIVDLPPGKMFVHRNVANLCLPADMNFLAVLHYAVLVLKIEHIIVCGHYGCGGVRAAMEGTGCGLIDNWLQSVKDTRRREQSQLQELGDASERLNRLCELSAIDQVLNLTRNPIVQAAWAENHRLTVHGWIYDLRTGLLRDLGVSADRPLE